MFATTLLFQPESEQHIMEGVSSSMAMAHLKADIKQQIDNAKKFLNSEQGQGLKQQLFGTCAVLGMPFLPHILTYGHRWWRLKHPASQWAH